jgi:hypothetical protein
MKSKSIAKTGLPSTSPIGRVVMPRPVRWNGTFHQWLRRILAASRILPTTWANRCSVSLESFHSCNGIAGNISMAQYSFLPHRAPRRASQRTPTPLGRINPAYRRYLPNRAMRSYLKLRSPAPIQDIPGQALLRRF